LILAQNAEIAQLIARFTGERLNGSTAQQLEILVRTAVFKSANEVVAYLFQQAADQIDRAYQPKPGQHYKGRVRLELQGVFGSFSLERDYYYEPGSNQGHYPADAGLGLEGSYTPALARLICLEGADETSFQKAQEHLRETGGMEVDYRQIQRLVQQVGPAAQRWQEIERPPLPCDAPILYVSGDGTGVPMRKEELLGRKGKAPDGSAKSRQAYLGCVFTQHKRDQNGSPIRDHDSTTYVSSFGAIDDFGLLLRKEALHRGSGTADKIILLIDGASGLENMGRINFNGCLQIVDFYHALEHLKELMEALWGKGHPGIKKQLRRWTKLLLRDGVQKIIDEAKRLSIKNTCSETQIDSLHYFEHNVQRMQYGTFRNNGYFIGSGVVEAGCKTVIGARCKQSGMFWSKKGAGNILAMRCIKSSRRWEEFWRNRANEHAARNDALSLAA
jgi:hypothetical protein